MGQFGIGQPLRRKQDARLSQNREGRTPPGLRVAGGVCGEEARPRTRGPGVSLPSTTAVPDSAQGAENWRYVPVFDCGNVRAPATAHGRAYSQSYGGLDALRRSALTPIDGPTKPERIRRAVPGA